MGRAPCCEKMGLKKGQWTPEEDSLLVSYIQKHGHSNWRRLPKQAGLSRCGKSCRLRWINYLRPGIKRGNLSREEEDAIIKLHEQLGNRWSAIAAMLPGRTDNEIKNIWHTYLKKRLKENHFRTDNSQHTTSATPISVSNISRESKPENSNFGPNPSPQSCNSVSSQLCHSNCTLRSSVSDACSLAETKSWVKEEDGALSEELSIWSEGALSEKSSMQLLEFPAAYGELQLMVPFTSVGFGDSGTCIDDCMKFWYNLLARAGGTPDLPEF